VRRSITCERHGISGEGRKGGADLIARHNGLSKSRSQATTGYACPMRLFDKQARRHPARNRSGQCKDSPTIAP
jgi:hypothetical protein